MKTIPQIAGMMSLVAAVLSCNAEALELKDLHLPMTRDEADGSLTKDYKYTILSDSTVRRTWKLKGRTVHVDFKLNKQGQALCIAVEYAKPVNRKTVHNDIKAITPQNAEIQKNGCPLHDGVPYARGHAPPLARLRGRAFYHLRGVKKYLYPNGDDGRANRPDL